MSGVNETIAREYFEELGFLVQQPRKYMVAARPKRPDEEVDLLILNPQVTEQQLPDRLVWTSADLGGVARGIVRVLGWHSDRFSPAVLETSPEIFRFAAEESVRRVAGQLGAGPVAKILCLPGLSHSDELKQRTLVMLQERGIDGLLSFPVMLRELISRIEVSKSYEKSDLQQVLRILKSYDLIKGPQMELFRRASRPRKQEA